MSGNDLLKEMFFPKKEKDNQNINKIRMFVTWLCRNPAKRTITIYGKKLAGRNDPCPCGSKMKYKHCCWSKHQPHEVTQEQTDCSKKLSAYYDKRYQELTEKNAS